MDRMRSVRKRSPFPAKSKSNYRLGWCGNAGNGSQAQFGLDKRNAAIDTLGCDNGLNTSEAPRGLLELLTSVTDMRRA